MTTWARPGGCAGSNYPFLTLKERDNETGLDYFLARYYSSTQGRFTSPDEFTGGPDELYYFVDDASDNPTFYADLRKPQSLNKYHYSFNNPLRYVDPDGHDPEEAEPQDPKPVVPVPVPVGPGLPVPITLSPSTPGPTDQQIIGGVKSVLDTVADYTGITALADWLRPKIMPTPAPPTTTTPPTQQVQPMPPPPPVEAGSHRMGKRKSTEKKHQEGTARKQRDYGGEKGDVVRRPPRRPPGGKTPKGGWPPKPPNPPEPPKPKPPEPRLPG